MTMHVRRVGSIFLIQSPHPIKFRRYTAFQVVTAGMFLLLALSSGQAAKAQDKLPTPPALKPAENAEQIDTADIEQRFLDDITRAVIRLDASGDRTMDAIENSQITLTLDTIQNSSQLVLLCNNGRKTLNAFAQSLAANLQLNGKVSEAVCIGNGHDDNPFVLKFRLHYESGGTSLFYEYPPKLPFIVKKLLEEEVEGSSASPNPSDFQDLSSESALQPVMLNPRRLQESHATIQIPQGWTPVKLPAPVHADSVFGMFDFSATFADGILTFDSKLALKRDNVENVELPALQQWTETVEGGIDVALRSTQYYPDRNASAGTEDQKKAADLIDEAYRDIHAQKFDKAEVALKQAEEIDPIHEVLHEDKGELAAARGDDVTALAEYRKELESFPNALFEMGSIARAQRKLGDTDGAMITLQRWMRADPNSSFAATELMEQYHSMGNDDLAVDVGDEAMNTMTNDAKRCVDFLLIYGHEQMLTGQASKAKTTLEALLDLTADVQMVNNAAYDLSEQGLSLDRIEQAVREALTEFDPDNPASALSISYRDTSTERTSALLSTWDTLGWILYKKGAVQEAEGYVRAAWQSKQDIAISRHLGDILTAEGKPVDAMNVYTLGLATVADVNASGQTSDSDVIAVRDALVRLKRKGNVPSVTDTKAGLLALRTLDLGPVAKPHGAKPYTVNLTASELTSYTDDGDGMQEPITLNDKKLLAGFFPPGSKAQLTRKGTILCKKICSVVFAQ